MAIKTPDFYRYAPAPLHRATGNNGMIALVWPDGAALDCYHLWLWENAVGDGAIHDATREGTIDPIDLPAANHHPSVAVDHDGHLCLGWPDGTERTYHSGWLRHVADGAHGVSAMLPEPVAWNAATLPEPRTHQATRVVHDDDARRLWLEDVVRYGIGRLSGAPLDHDFIAELAAPIGPLRDTNFGLLWSVRVDLDPNSTANTSLRLAPHSDLPTREVPPGFQILHCIENTTVGGHSAMTDGLAVVDRLRQDHPDEYEALTTLRWVFFNRSPDHDHRFSGPIIDYALAGGGAPFTLRAFHPVRAFPDMDPSDIPRAYEAMRVFAAVSADPELQIRYPFAAGDVVMFDNRRVLHARDAYDNSIGSRFLRGSYIDHDEVFSCLRVLNRKALQ